MKNSLRLFVLLSIVAMAIFFPVALLADTVYVHSDVSPNEGGLNTAISNVSNLSTTVFKLDAGGYYILSGAITVPPNQHLTIVADEATISSSAPPQILETSQVSLSYLIDCFGDVTLKNLWLTYANTGGTQKGTPVEFDEDSIRHKNTGVFEGCIFDYAPVPGAIEIRATNFNGVFKGCYWRNNTDSHYRYYGRSISFPYATTGWHQDTVSFENCTFSNLGYAYMGYQPGEGTPETVDYITFNHCTFINTMMHALEPSFWEYVSVTNCLYTNIFMYGDIIVNRETPWQLSGAINIDSLSAASTSAAFPLVNVEANRHILFANNSYYLEKWLTDFMKGGNAYSDTAGVIFKPHPMPMLSARTISFFEGIDPVSGKKAHPYIVKANLDSTDNPGFVQAPTNQAGIDTFLIARWLTGANVDWSYNASDDINGLWPMNEDLSYSNATLKAAGMAGYPLGDLYHWWPTQYASWAQQQASEHSRINTWLSTGSDPGSTGVQKQPGVPNNYELSQNYPNPFNPTTRIDYSIPEKNHVSLKVYNLIGQEVATLVDGIQQAGKYAATFDGKNLASGVYFYRLQTGEYSVTKKLVLLK